MKCNHSVSIKLYVGSLLLFTLGGVLQVKASPQSSSVPDNKYPAYLVAESRNANAEPEATRRLDPQLTPILNGNGCCP